MNIFEEVEKLNFPKDEFMVLGSGILGALGIREIGDVDLLITPELFEKLKDSGWKYEIIEIEGRPRDMVSKGDVQCFKEFWWEGGELTTREGIAMGESINGVNFVPLLTILEAKKAMKREKDLKDVTLIEKYLNSKK